MKVLILNHCSHNKGDNSVLHYLMECIDIVTSRTADFTVSCSDGKPPFWLSKHIDTTYWPGGKIFKSPQSTKLGNFISRANFYVMRKVIYKGFLFSYSKNMKTTSKLIANLFLGQKLIKSIRDADHVICTGGHHISNVLEKDCINPQLIALCLSDLYGKKTTLWSQSIGPFAGAPDYALNAISKSFNSAKHIFVRDQLSIDCTSSISKNSVQKAPDSVFLSSLLPDQSDSSENLIVCAVYTAGISNQEYLEEYLMSWSTVSRALEQQGLKVIFIPMQYKGYGGDERDFLKKLVASCNSKNISYVDEDSSPKQTIELFKRAKCIIGHKTHSVIYGLALGVPTVAIAYHEKTNYFMSLYNLKDYVFPEIIGHETHIVAAALSAIESANSIEIKAQSKTYGDQLLNNMKLSIGT